MEEKPRLARLTAILTQLQSKRILTARELAERYQVSIRTIYRDIRTLEQSGIPIITEEGKGYSLMEGFNLPPVTFTEAEAQALITAEQLILKNKDLSFTTQYQNAVSKIKSTLRHSQKEKVELLSQRIYFRQNIENLKTSEYLMTIQSAIADSKLIELDYLSLEKKQSKRSVEPFALYSTQDNWLLIAFCRLRNDFRAFRLDQIQALQVLHEQFEPQKITLQEYFEICREKSISDSNG
ncbi:MULTISPECIES: YafY family protein [unclassified Lentimicrobium]|uniref:helix-turn-helix transcriptional regulator n=1 Tax=unclassified Lentimicrobium TaxID=2677434 RepID=UPI0015565F89|nr:MULTISPECIES: YafY family protein [unclassified Lentimicrobium]NPD45889.1 YafY family transcriptional regulator [Lentimicrobium sp. S6]NPD86791.1 YafY family transcriptional regulator [Lentimicrobium sp. L6]